MFTRSKEAAVCVVCCSSFASGEELISESAENFVPTEAGGLPLPRALAGVLLGVALLERVFAAGGLMVVSSGITRCVPLDISGSIVRSGSLELRTMSFRERISALAPLVRCD